jgi:hypothetical protein
MALFPLDSETEMWLITLLHCSNAAYRINGNGRWHMMTDCGQMASPFPQQQQPYMQPALDQGSVKLRLLGA